MNELIKIISDGGAPIMMFLCLYFVWRELVRGRAACEEQINRMHGIQIQNIRKISELEAKVEVLQSKLNLQK